MAMVIMVMIVVGMVADTDINTECPRSGTHEAPDKCFSLSLF